MIKKIENKAENRTQTTAKPNAKSIDNKGIKSKMYLVFGVRQKREWTV